jgi:UDPglucose 6-dehydrogenase
LILVTEWQEYRELDWADLAKRMRKPVLLDGRNILDRAQMTQAGFRYLGLAG